MLKQIVLEVLTLAIIGVILGLIEQYIPMSPPIKMLIRIVIVVGVVYYLVSKYL